MRKIERHERNLRLYGEKHCPRQVEVRGLSELATEFFREMKEGSFSAVGLRTDWLPGQAPKGDLGKLPFFHALRSWRECMEVYWTEIRQYPAPLTVLVCESIPPEHTRANFVAQRLDDEHMLVELDSGGQAQRDMDSGAVRTFGVGPSSYVFPFDTKRPIRCYNPEDVWRWQLDRVYRFLFTNHENELTGTLASDGRLLFW